MIPVTWLIAAAVILIAFVLLALRWRKPAGHVTIHMWHDSNIRWERLLAESRRGAEGRLLMVVATHFGETHNAITDAWREAGYTWGTPDTAEQLLEAINNAAAWFAAHDL